MPMPSTPKIEINRAPVLTLWPVIVAERLGYAVLQLFNLMQSTVR
jgi:hypothetical protein